MTNFVKKLTLAALAFVGKTQAQSELFLQQLDQAIMELDQEMEISNDAQILSPKYVEVGDENDTTETQKVHKGQCQLLAGSYLYDLSKFDKIIREKNKAASSINQDQSKRLFQYKVCQGDWALTPGDDMKASAACGSGNSGAYMSNIVFGSQDGLKNSDFTCSYSFHNPTFAGIENYEDDVQLSAGYELVYTSKQNYTINTPFKMHVQVKCNKEFTSTSDQLVGGSNGVERFLTYEGPEGCPVANLDTTGLVKVLEKFTGAIEIIGGLILCFFGSKFIFYVIRVLLFVVINTGTWLLFYNLNLTDFNSQNKFLILVGLVALAAGIAGAYYLGNFAERYGACIVAGCTGAAVTCMILANSSVSTSNKQLIVIGVVAVCAYLGATYNKYVKSAGTGIIGAFFLMHGIGQYAGGFPPLMGEFEVDGESYNMNDFKENPSYFAYIGGMFVFSVLGTFIQLKYIAPDDEDSDDMMAKDYC